MSMTNIDELIVYSNSRNGLGIRVFGSKRPSKKSGIYIRQLLDNGLAQRDGRLKVGDQILSINDESAIGISREYAVNVLRSAAATNEVCLHVQHFPNFSDEFQKLLFDGKSTDDDDEEIHRISNHNRSVTRADNEVQMRRTSRTRQQEQQQQQQQQYRHSTYNPSFSNRKDHKERNIDGQFLKGLDVSHDALQSILNSRFKLIDLIDLLKKSYPKMFINDDKREFQFIQQVSETNTDGRISLKDFERQSSVLLGERINLLLPFYSSSTRSSNTNDNQIIIELRREIGLCRSTIDDLQNEMITCEKSQRLSEEVEVEYEDLLKFVYEQLREYKLNEINQSKLIQANDQLIQKLFNYISTNINQSTDKHILSQLKYQYEQQSKFLLTDYQQNVSTRTNKKYHQHV